MSIEKRRDFDYRKEAISAAMAVNLKPTDYVVTIYRGVHDHIAKGVPLLDRASGRVSEVSGRVSLVVDALEARAADPGTAPALVRFRLETSSVLFA